MTQAVVDDRPRADEVAGVAIRARRARRTDDCAGRCLPMPKHSVVSQAWPASRHCAINASVRQFPPGSRADTVCTACTMRALMSTGMSDGTPARADQMEQPAETAERQDVNRGRHEQVQQGRVDQQPLIDPIFPGERRNRCGHAIIARKRIRRAGGCLKQRADEVAVLVEARGLADDRHDAVGVGELEEAVDRLVAQPRDHVAQRSLLRVELLAELGRATRARRPPASPRRGDRPRARRPRRRRRARRSGCCSECRRRSSA